MMNGELQKKFVGGRLVMHILLVSFTEYNFNLHTGLCFCFSQDLMDYLDANKDEYTEHLKRRKRQDLEAGGVVSFVKVTY